VGVVMMILCRSGVESAVDEFDAPAGHFADVVAAFAHAPPALASLAAGVIERFFGTLKYEHLYRPRSTTAAR
jgi:hypothetical protein